MKDEYLEYYERVKQLSKLKNMALTDVLKNAGINPETYKSYKRYGNLPRADEAYEIAKILETSVEFLITGTECEQVDHSAEVITAVRKALEQFK